MIKPWAQSEATDQWTRETDYSEPIERTAHKRTVQANRAVGRNWCRVNQSRTWHSCGDHATEWRLQRLLAIPGQSITPTGSGGPARAAERTASIAVGAQPAHTKQKNKQKKMQKRFRFGQVLSGADRLNQKINTNATSKDKRYIPRCQGCLGTTTPTQP